MAKKENRRKSGDKTKIEKGTLRRIFPFYKPYKGLFALDLLSAFIMSIAGLVFPVLVRVLMYDVLGDDFKWAFFVPDRGNNDCRENCRSRVQILHDDRRTHYGRAHRKGYQNEPF